MIASHQIVADRFRRAICQQHAAIVAEHRVPNCRIDADTRRATCKDKISDSKPTQGLVQLSFKEAAESVLIQHDIVWLWVQFLYNVRVPSILNQKSSFSAIRRDALLSHSEIKVPRPIH